MKFEVGFNTKEQGVIFKELGVEEESYYVWCFHKGQCSEKTTLANRIKAKSEFKGKIYPAFSCAELGVLLAQIKSHDLAIYSRHATEIKTLKDYIEYNARLYAKNKTMPTAILRDKNIDVYDRNLAHAQSDLLIYAIHHTLIKPKDLRL